MSALRLVIVAAVALVLAAAPLLPQGLVTSSGDGGVSVHAATASSPLAGGNDNDDDDNGDDGDNGDDDNGGDDNDDGNDGDNDDNEGNDNGDNDDGDNEDGDDNDDGGDGRAPPPPPAVAAAPATVSGCIANGASVTLDFPGGTATVTNVIAQGINVRLERAAPAAGPQGQLDAIIFNAFFENCGGGGLADPPPNVNLGIRYTVGANKGGLRIVTLQGNQFAEAGIVTVPDPDPNNPYISATIPARTAAYSVVQR